MTQKITIIYPCEIPYFGTFGTDPMSIVKLQSTNYFQELENGDWELHDANSAKKEIKTFTFEQMSEFCWNNNGYFEVTVKLESENIFTAKNQPQTNNPVQ